MSESEATSWTDQSTSPDTVDSTTPPDVSPETEVTTTNPEGSSFPKFPLLPAEIRVLVYRQAAFEAMHRVHTIGLHQDCHDDWIVVAYAQQMKHNLGGLPHACREAKEEAERLCITLPTRFVTDVGANIININHGPLMLPLRSFFVGNRRYYRDSTFYVGEHEAIELFKSIYAERLMPAQLGWLRDLMVDRRTFQHLLSGFHDFSRGRPGAPFTALPSLRRIVVGFVYRFQDVALVEGRYDDIVTEAQVMKNPQGVGEPGSYSVTPGDVHPMIKIMITSTVRQTIKEVADLKAAGIEVVWGAVTGAEGVTRRPDILADFLAFG